MVDRVFVGIDGSEGSMRALQWAIAEAEARRAVLQPVLVWQSPSDFGEAGNLLPEEIAERARGVLDKALLEVSSAHRGVRIEPVVTRGDAAQRLCALSRGSHLVVGSRGLGVIREAMLGSVSAKCARRAHCPITIVPALERQGTRADLARVERIAVGIDGSQASLRALRWATDEAAVRKASVIALLVWQDPYGGEDMSLEFAMPYFRRDRNASLEIAREKLMKALAGAAVSEAPVEITPEVFEGDPAETLCEQSTEADLLVVGSAGLGALGRVLVGSVSSDCARRSHCPVTIVPRETL